MMGDDFRRACRGFTLVEAMTSMVILAVLVMAMLGVVPATYGYTERCMVRIQAVAAGQQYLDSIRQYIKTTGVATGLPPAPAVAIDPGKGFVSQQQMPSPGNFSMSPTCTARSLFSFDCAVSVRWSQNGIVQSALVESYVASQAGF
jgi:prepilin-type N-terminal cleavage/methylation domain-containing protein